jgi:hypothetical protein
MRRPRLRTAALVSAFVLLSTATLHASRFVTSAEADLNGDGVTERISLETLGEHGEFELGIDDATIEGKLDVWLDGFQIVDIDTGDQLKEVAVHTAGPSDDDAYVIYWLDGSVIKLVGGFARWPTFTGDGTVYVQDHMGFWGKTDKYVLDRESHELALVPQEFHWVGVTGTAVQEVAIYETRGLERAIEHLSPGGEVQILLWYPGAKWEEHRYLVRSATNIVGWLKMSTLQRTVGGLPYAD